jgi:hypothetical protein
MVATKPLMLVSTDCASAIASSPQTETKTRRIMAPMNLRVRMDIGALHALQLRLQGQDYMVRAASNMQAFDGRSR